MKDRYYLIFSIVLILIMFTVGSANATGYGSAALRDAEDTLTDGSNLPDGAAIKAYGDATYQPLEATLTDIADGTITENLVNTAIPWADNEVGDNLTVTALSGSSWNLADTITANSVYLGTTSLEETTAANDSGAYIVGVFDEFTNSNSTNVQDVLDDLDAAISSGMVYPGAGIALSTGAAWDTSITNNSTNWNTAYTDRMKWDGGATGLVAATGRTSLELGTAAIRDAEDTLTDGSNLPDGAAIKAYGDANWGGGSTLWTDSGSYISPTTNSEIKIYDASDNNNPTLSITKTVSPTSDRDGAFNTTITRSGGQEQSAVFHMYSISAAHTTGCDIGLTSVTEADNISGGQVFGGWIVSASPNSNTGNWGIVGLEINTFNRYANESLQTTPGAKWSAGLQLVAEDTLNVGDGPQTGYDCAFGMRIARANGGTGTWNIPIFIQKQATTASGYSIYIGGGEDAADDPAAGIKFGDDFYEGINFESATLNSTDKVAIHLADLQSIRLDTSKIWEDGSDLKFYDPTEGTETLSTLVGGTIAQQDASNVAITGGSISGISTFSTTDHTVTIGSTSNSNTVLSLQTATSSYDTSIGLYRGSTLVCDLKANSAGTTSQGYTGSLYWYSYTDSDTRASLTSGGNLSVDGTVTASCGTLTCDYVFEKDYNLMPLDTLQEFVEREKRLPNMTIQDGGHISSNTMRQELVEKIEEQSLYILQLHDRIKRLEVSK